MSTHKKKRFAQGFIATSNLPESLEELTRWVGGPWEEGITPVDQVLLWDQKLDGPFAYSAPARARAGDFIFLHFAARAIRGAVSLRREAEANGSNRGELKEYLEHIAAIAGLYGGCIYAFAELAGPPAPEPRRDDFNPYWRNRLYAPLGRIHKLKYPILLSDHFDALPRPVSAITTMGASQFGALKERIIEGGNKLPKILAATLPGTSEIGIVTSRNWRRKSCGEDVVFTNEADVRGLFADYVLAELADKHSELFKEVRCLRAQRGTFSGSCRADYVVKFDGLWLPVETKLSLWSWPDIIQQTGEYISMNAFDARTDKGARVRIGLEKSDRFWNVSLVIDREGLYVVSASRFLAGSPGRPFIARKSFGELTGEGLKRRLRAVVRSPAEAPHS